MFHGTINKGVIFMLTNTETIMIKRLLERDDLMRKNSLWDFLYYNAREYAPKYKVGD